MGKSVKTVIFGLGNYWDSVKSFLSDKVKIVAYMDNHVKCMGGGEGICAGAMA